MQSKAWNKRLASSIAIVSAAFLVALIVLVLLLPDETFEYADRPNVKYLLVFGSVSGVLFASVQLYFMFYQQTATRFITWVETLLLATFAPATGFTFIAWPRYAAFNGPSLEAGFTFEKASSEAWIVLAIYVFAMLAAALIHKGMRKSSIQLGEEL